MAILGLNKDNAYLSILTKCEYSENVRTKTFQMSMENRGIKDNT